MTTGQDTTRSNPSTYYGIIAILIIVAFTAIGFFIALYWTNDTGTVREGFWAGMGFEIVFLLSSVANNLERLRSDF